MHIFQEFGVSIGSCLSIIFPQSLSTDFASRISTRHFLGSVITYDSRTPVGQDLTHFRQSLQRSPSQGLDFTSSAEVATP